MIQTRMVTACTALSMMESPSNASAKVTPFSGKAAQEAALKLGEIAKRFETWDDPLSKQLHLFVGITLKKAQSYKGENPHSFIQERISKLSAILVGFDKAPLKEPILVEGRTWERWVYEECHAGSEHKKHQAHTYAMEIHEWMKHIMGFLPQAETTVATRSTGGQLSPALIQTSSPAMVQLVLQQLINKQDLMCILKETQDWMELQGSLLEETRREMALLSERALKLAQEKAAGHEEAVKKQLTEIESIHAKTVANLEADKAWHAAEAEKRIAELEQKASALTEQRVQERKALAAQVEAIRQAQRSQEAALNSQLASLKQEHSSVVEQMKKHVGAVHTQCATLQNTVSEAQSRTQVSEGRALELSKKVEVLKGELARANQRVLQVQAEARAAIEDAENSFCVIQ